MAAGADRPRTASKLSVLVIDDDQNVREFLEDFLGLEGFQVATLGDPSDAISRIRTELFHLIMLDIMMPKLDGIDLLAQIRAVDDDIAVIMMTGHPSLDSAMASIRLGVSGYVAHPLTPAGLREVIAQVTKRNSFVLRREADLHSEIGRQVRDRRKACGMRIAQMARRTKLPVSLLSQIERGESSASVSCLYKVATALDVRVTDLLAGY